MAALDLPFAGEEFVRRISELNGEPEWLLADRLAALKLYEELPVETNSLFTLYVDLRGAKFNEISAYESTGYATNVAETLPEGAAALIEIAEDKIVARAFSAEARQAGVVIDTFAQSPETKSLSPETCQPSSTKRIGPV